jgi:hypothetical protein
MPKSLRELLVIVLLMGLWGCAGVQRPTSEQLINADYGIYPTTYKEVTSQYISNLLIDPYSAVFSDWRGPIKGWYGNNRTLLYGYMICVAVNAKNRMGGYSGRKLYYILIKNDRVEVHDGGDYRSGTYGEERIYKMCNF